MEWSLILTFLNAADGMIAHTDFLKWESCQNCKEMDGGMGQTDWLLTTAKAALRVRCHRAFGRKRSFLIALSDGLEGGRYQWSIVGRWSAGSLEQTNQSSKIDASATELLILLDEACVELLGIQEDSRSSSILLCKTSGSFCGNAWRTQSMILSSPTNIRSLGPLPVKTWSSITPLLWTSLLCDAFTMDPYSSTKF
jgi:hypothetical protein